MPTNANAYNSRVTDEALEKRFRDTFRSQGGSELVDDLYAQGVIVPIVDFTAAATGQQLAQNLQTAWDFSTGAAQINNANATLITNSGFWQVGVNLTASDLDAAAPGPLSRIWIDDGTTEKNIWGVGFAVNSFNQSTVVTSDTFVVFLRAGDSLQGNAANGGVTLDVWYRQIATVSGDLVNPSGFTSS